MAIYRDEEANGGLEAAWPSVLRAITEVARQSAASEQDVLRAVSQEFTRLRMRGSVALLGPDGLLEIRTRSDSMAVETAISRLVGVPITGYRFDPNQVDLYRQAIEARSAIYSPDRPSVIRQMFPPHLRPIFPRLIRLMGVQPVIVAPLILDVDVIGTINVTAAWLAPEDAAMVQALADNLAVALDHVRSRLNLEAALAREQNSRRDPGGGGQHPRYGRGLGPPVAAGVASCRGGRRLHCPAAFRKRDPAAALCAWPS